MNKQKKIACERELFKPHYTHEKIKNFLGNDPKKWVNIKNENLEEYLMLMSNISNKPIFGYKILFEHFKFFKDKQIYLNYLKNNKSKIILLTRDNLLLKYISHRTSKAIKNYSSIFVPQNNIVYQLNPIEINYYKYKEYAEQQKKFLQERIDDINLYKLPCAHIKYEDFVGEKYLESMAKIYQLLNLRFKTFKDLREPNGIVLGFKKINIYNMKDKMINYEKFKKEAEDNNDIETLNFLG
jgi:hypothetical protein